MSFITQMFTKSKVQLPMDEYILSMSRKNALKYIESNNCTMEFSAPRQNRAKLYKHLNGDDSPVDVISIGEEDMETNKTVQITEKYSPQLGSFLDMTYTEAIKYLKENDRDIDFFATRETRNSLYIHLKGATNPYDIYSVGEEDGNTKKRVCIRKKT